MKNLFKLFFTSFLAISLVVVSFAQNELEVDGTYQGDEIYVQNPLNNSTNTFCIKKVTVNNKELEKELINTSAFIIPLEGMQVGKYVNIKIEYDNNCRPRVLNAEALRSKATFELVTIKVEGNKLKFTTKNETTEQPFIVERFKNSKWTPIDVIVGKGPDGFNNYETEVSHYTGLNRYRVKQADLKPGRWKFALPVEFMNDREPITFYPRRISKELFFSDAAEYEIYDSFGSIVKKGVGEKIDLEELEAGVYYLNYDGRTEKFLKK